MKVIGIIPARFASTRFPGKPLVEIRGKSMIRRVYEQAIKCTALSEVVVATDHAGIFDHVQQFGRAVMTSPEHQSGTDRCREAIELINNGKYEENDVVVNIQGDEPFIHPLQIELLIGVFANPKACIGSLYKKIEINSELFDEHTVKVVINMQKKAIYFSRNPIPFFRGLNKPEWLNKANYFKHIGVYGYRISMLEKLSRLPKGNLEKAESLEQLRWIEHGFDIFMNETGMQHISIDTPEDLEKINNC